MVGYVIAVPNLLQGHGERSIYGEDGSIPTIVDTGGNLAHTVMLLFLMKEELMVRKYHLLNVLVAILLVVGLLAPSTAIASSSTTVKLWIGNASMSVNGVQQLIDVQGTKPVIVAGRTLVPIRAVIEAFTSMENDLNSEKKVMNKHWARREGEINRVMTSTVGLYGDLQGIAGANIPEIEGLGMEALGEPDPVVRVFGALGEPEEKA